MFISDIVMHEYLKKASLQCLNINWEYSIMNVHRDDDDDDMKLNPQDTSRLLSLMLLFVMFCGYVYTIS